MAFNKKYAGLPDLVGPPVADFLSIIRLTLS
jgi:hypothetical protein